MTVEQLEAAPAHLHVPAGARGTYGAEVADLAELVGRPLDAAQRAAVDALTSYGPGGRWLAFETAVLAPRQNGKTSGIVLPIVLADLFLWSGPGEVDRIVWTAHLMSTARAAFTDAQLLIDGCDALRRRVKQIRTSNEETSIELTSGSVLEFAARSKGGGRGKGSKRVVLDEALFLRSEPMASLLPTLAARANTQVSYASSAALEESEYLRQLVARGRGGRDDSLAYVEWCAPGSWAEPACAGGPGCTHALGEQACALDDEAALRAANPAVAAGRIALSTLGALRRALDPTDFGREFLGWHQEPPPEEEVREPALDVDAWGLRVDAGSAPEGRVGFGVEVSPDRARTVLAVAGRRPDGRLHVEVAKVLPGTGRAVEELQRLCAEHGTTAALATSTPTGSLLEELERRRVPVLTPTVPQFAGACGRLHDAVRDDQLRHRGQLGLDGAVRKAAKRATTEGAWRFDRRGVDISEVCAVTLALFALTESGDGEGFNIW